MFGNRIFKDDYSNLKEKIDIINFKDLEDRLNEIEHILFDNKYKYENYLSECNDNFKNHLKRFI